MTAAATVHDDGAEKAVLGILLLTPDATPDARRRLSTDDFYKPLHQTLFAAACRLDDEQKPVEAAALLSELTRTGEIKNTGETASYIAELVSNAPASAALGHYTSLVKDAGTRRALALMGLRAQELASAGGADNPAAIVETLRNQLDNLATDRIGSEVPLSGEVVAATLDEIDALAKGESVVGIPTGFHELDHALNGLRPGQMVIVAARPGAGKALALDTPIPTPAGWTSMGDLAVGDLVLGRDGKPTTVTAATDVMYGRDCFEVVFSDGSTLVADADHQWVTDTIAERLGEASPELDADGQRKSRTTSEILATLYVDSNPNHVIWAVDTGRLPLAHKAHATEVAPRDGYHTVVAVNRVPSVPVRCIQVDNDEHLYLAGRAMIPTHNTAMGLDWVRHAAIRQKKSVMMFSLEMGRTELMMRMLSAEAYVDLQSMKTGDLDDHKWQQLAAAAARFADAKLGIDDTATVTITEIRAKARAFQRAHGLDMIVIDYLQLMNSDRKTDSRQQEVSDISRGVKLLAKEFGVPVIALSQLNRGSESRSDKKPVISDLRESGSLEQDADVVLLLHREEMYEKESPRAGEADVIIAKQRSGPTGTVVLSWLGKYSRFDNRTI
jgi:replicative DNA helicase